MPPRIIGLRDGGWGTYPLVPIPLVTERGVKSPNKGVHLLPDFVNNPAFRGDPGAHCRRGAWGLGAPPYCPGAVAEHRASYRHLMQLHRCLQWHLLELGSPINGCAQTLLPKLPLGLQVLLGVV